MKSLVRSIASGISYIALAEGILAGIAALLIVFPVVVGVIMRYVFRSPLAAANDLAKHGFVVIIALALALALKQKRHVRVEILTDRLPARVQKVLMAISMALLFLYCVAVTWGVWLLLADTIKDNVHSMDAGIPLVIPQGAMLLGLVAFTLLSLVETVKAISNSKTEKQSENIDTSGL